MSIVDKKGRLFGKISLIDILIVLIIVGAAAGVYVKFFSTAGKAAPMSKIQYDIEIKDVDKNFIDAINSGGPIRESTKGNELGKVTGKRSYKATKLNKDTINGKYVETEIPGMYDVTISVEADASITTKDILVDGVDIRVGKKLFVKGKGYANTCFVTGLTIERE